MRRIIAVILVATVAASAASAAIAATPAAAYPLFFQPWSAAIDANAATTIAAAAKAALANPTFPVIVTGSADTVGSVAANKDMALTRAQVVADALVADGVGAGRVAVVTSGSIAAPGAASGTPAQFSRRVLIRVGN